LDELLKLLRRAAAPLEAGPARERYRGSLLGLACGNALGLQVEGVPADEIRRHLPAGVRDIHPDEAARDWDDDVAQALVLGDCLLSGPLDVDVFLERLVEWMEVNGRGIGRQTWEVLQKAKAGAEGTAAAWAVWEASGRYRAGNGAVMRCAPVALRWRLQPQRLVKDAVSSARATHYDPRCVWTTVATCAVLALELAGADWTLEELAEALEDAGAPPEVIVAVELSESPEVADLELDEWESMGYTIRAMTAALWTATHAEDFEATLLAVINAGGDTDTNGAVAGAVLGARFGAAAVPGRWKERLPNPWEMEGLADRLLEASSGSEG
jgi:ADP-ribosyl-[dinitrogen reductase] hydrolase